MRLSCRAIFHCVDITEEFAYSKAIRDHMITQLKGSLFSLFHVSKSYENKHCEHEILSQARG